MSTDRQVKVQTLSEKDKLTDRAIDGVSDQVNPSGSRVSEHRFCLNSFPPVKM